MAGSRRCIPRSMAGCSAVRGKKGMSRRSRIMPSRRSTSLPSTSIPSRARRGQRRGFRDLHREHRYRGPALIRAGAKNHASVTVVVDPADYLPRARRDGEEWRRHHA